MTTKKFYNGSTNPATTTSGRQNRNPPKKVPKMFGHSLPGSNTAPRRIVTAHPGGDHTHNITAHTGRHWGVTARHYVTVTQVGVESELKSRCERAACAINADALAAVRGAALPGTQQLTGGAGPPSRPRAQPVRAPRPAPRHPTPPRARAQPLIHYLRTADRFQAFVLPAPHHDHDDGDRSNLMPFLCPASNAIRLRPTNCGTSYESRFLHLSI
ncbi:hypothetical protein ACJJTC_016354 [Scirpophaga incertulas]